MLYIVNWLDFDLLRHFVAYTLQFYSFDVPLLSVLASMRSFHFSASALFRHGSSSNRDFLKSRCCLFFWGNQLQTGNLRTLLLQKRIWNDFSSSRGRFEFTARAIFWNESVQTLHLLSLLLDTFVCTNQFKQGIFGVYCARHFLGRVQFKQEILYLYCFQNNLEGFQFKQGIV